MATDTKAEDKKEINIQIEQQTKGDQSPAVISEGDVNITFGDEKED